MKSLVIVGFKAVTTTRHRLELTMPTTKLKTDLSKLLADNGLDLTVLPPVMTPPETAQVLRTTVTSLAQDRFRGVGVPYVKYGSRIRYLRADVGKYLLDNHVTPSA
ncbi:hypothetical protein B8W69_06565 [Mycobacterium vulneris]|uniref:Uncharacterized protein n=1 Tax=Mycolicibacterium vulneris TaxID=547163 RepID=A0A1X2L9M5_9MYCO|nr:hypothetical protein [Mycolicibacterium vulneris]OSC30694.1 hypothetical protein B8W69_06565 [Mycolicibacterium vulneris]